MKNAITKQELNLLKIELGNRYVKTTEAVVVFRRFKGSKLEVYLYTYPEYGKALTKYDDANNTETLHSLNGTAKVILIKYENNTIRVLRTKQFKQTDYNQILHLNPIK